MMENKVLKLKFRVIALVSNENDPNAKAKALFKKFKDAGIKDYLNNNALNQAGYDVEIENFTEMDNADVNDYFYAFDRADWTNKKYLSIVIKQKYDVIPGTNTCKPGSVDASGNCIKIPVPTETITEEDKIDDNVFEWYQEKLKRSMPSKNYEGGVIILCDYESPSDTSAFSRPTPLNHYKLFVYTKSVDRKEDYAHEIGHMLGLPHLFYDTKEKDAYRSAIENIRGSNEPKINPDGSENINYEVGIKKEISIAKNTDEIAYRMTQYMSDKKSLSTYISNFIVFYQEKLKRVNYTNEAKISINIEISKNQKALKELEKDEDSCYKEYKLECYFLRNDYIKYLERRKKYMEDVLAQLELNVLFFKQNYTQNFMDYYNSRLRFNHNQIKIMRNDSTNFLEEFCKCKVPAKKSLKGK